MMLTVYWHCVQGLEKLNKFVLRAYEQLCKQLYCECRAMQSHHCRLKQSFKYRANTHRAMQLNFEGFIPNSLLLRSAYKQISMILYFGCRYPELPNIAQLENFIIPRLA
jgi:hypothetical protein